MLLPRTPTPKERRTYLSVRPSVEREGGREREPEGEMTEAETKGRRGKQTAGGADENIFSV